MKIRCNSTTDHEIQANKEQEQDKHDWVEVSKQAKGTDVTKKVGLFEVPAAEVLQALHQPIAALQLLRGGVQQLHCGMLLFELLENISPPLHNDQLLCRGKCKPVRSLSDSNLCRLFLGYASMRKGQAESSTELDNLSKAYCYRWRIQLPASSCRLDVIAGSWTQVLRVHGVVVGDLGTDTTVRVLQRVAVLWCLLMRGRHLITIPLH